MTSKVTYLGGLRTECVHLRSGQTIITAAPIDNNGKGEAFSPTDLCVTALASCAMTIIGIYGKMHNVDVVGTEKCNCDWHPHAIQTEVDGTRVDFL